MFANLIFADRLLPEWLSQKLKTTENKIHYKTKALFAHDSLFSLHFHCVFAISLLYFKTKQSFIIQAVCCLVETMKSLLLKKRALLRVTCAATCSAFVIVLVADWLLSNFSVDVMFPWVSLSFYVKKAHNLYRNIFFLSFQFAAAFRVTWKYFSPWWPMKNSFAMNMCGIHMIKSWLQTCLPDVKKKQRIVSFITHEITFWIKKNGADGG